MLKAILWFTGLPGSGKTTLSKKLYKYLKKKKIKTKLIDGDNFRRKFNNYKYDNISREKLGVLKIKEGIKFFDRGYFVIISGVAYKKKWRNDYRRFCGKRIYKEIFLKCSIKKCIERNLNQNKNSALALKSKYKYQYYHNFDLKINTSCLDLHKSYIKLRRFIKI